MWVALTPNRFKPRDRHTGLLHLVGGWYIWISFAVAIGKRVPLDRFYWPMAALILAAGIVRLAAMWRRSRRRIAPA